mmetsp:Transcript_110727/g.323947  ORF Transcript_110727/g.323947 Transcript_110727/m.323947 type:complete len:155 (+) Transcript_110727:116-580(+)
MAKTVAMLGFLGTTTSLACLALAQAWAPAMPEVSSTKVTADTNSSVAADLKQVLRRKELMGLSPLHSTPAEELIDEAPASQGALPFACRCCLDLAVLVFTAMKLKPCGGKAAPEDSSSGAQQQSKPHQDVGRAAEPRAGHSSARELLLAWDSLA